jgi:hypothetical protein
LVGLEIASSKNDFANTDSNPPQQQLGFLQFKKCWGDLFGGPQITWQKVVKKTNNKHCTAPVYTALLQSVQLVFRGTPLKPLAILSNNKKKDMLQSVQLVFRGTPLKPLAILSNNKKKDTCCSHE